MFCFEEDPFLGCVRVLFWQMRIPSHLRPAATGFEFFQLHAPPALLSSLFSTQAKIKAHTIPGWFESAIQQKHSVQIRG